MKKRDFIQQACIEFMPVTQWDMDQSIKYAEKLWLRLDQKGYGERQSAKAKDMVNYYQSLSPTSVKQFDQFWITFDNKQGRQRAAMRWQQLGDISPELLKKIIGAAKQTAAARKNLNPDQTPIMAEGWLSQLRFDDFEETGTETQQKQQNQAAAAIREISGSLAHAKSMAKNTADDFWPGEIERLTEQLRQLRSEK